MNGPVVQFPARTIDCAHVDVEIRAPFVKRCPVKDEVDVGEVVITYSTLGGAYELHALARALASYINVTISHEDVTNDLAELLDARVETTWTTAGLAVTVTATPS